MFTGLIETIGTMAASEASATGMRARIRATNARDLAQGESISVSGVCLTVVETDDDSFLVDLSHETLRVTTLGRLAPGGHVNLERALRADGRFGGHVVQGHVDGVGHVVAIRTEGEGAWMTIDVPPGVAALTVPRGSIAIDGVSLTAAAIDGTRVGIQLVPFTLTHTTLGAARPGDVVNVESDILGKYVARLIGERPAG